ncbi:MAG: hypothetical protein ACRD0X_02875, partial [Thermoanaerobaculia bacterium]
MRKRNLLAAALGIALLLLATGPSYAQEGGDCRHGGGWRWTLRGLYAHVDTSGDHFRATSTLPSGEELRTSIGVGNGDGFGLGLEYRLTCLLGIDAIALSTDLDSTVMIDTPTEWLMTEDELGLDILGLGLNFHLT